MSTLNLFRLLTFLSLAIFLVNDQPGLLFAQTGPQKNRNSSKIFLKTGTFDPLVSPPKVPKSLQDMEKVTGHEYYLVQFNDHVTETTKKRLRSMNVDLIDYIPVNTYLLRMPPQTLAEVKTLPWVRWTEVFRPFFKLDPTIGKRGTKKERSNSATDLLLLLEVFPGESVLTVVQKIESMGIKILETHDSKTNRRLVVESPMTKLNQIAQIREISWIEEAPVITFRNNAATWVVQSNTQDMTTIWDQGIHGENQIIGIIDSLVNQDTCYLEDSTDNTPGPNHRKIVAYNTSDTGASSHGTHVAGIAVGENESGSLDNAGHAYKAKMTYANLSDIQGIGNITVSNLNQMLEQAHTDGARIHTNSWGDDGTTEYTALAKDIDTFSWNNEEDLVLFAVTNLSSLKTPENAKNVLAVGNSQRAPNQDNHCSGGEGPTSDGRRKPEIYAPGCSTVSAGTGSCNTATLTGTSMASPAVAGAAALIRQYYMEGWAPSGIKGGSASVTPSGALLKATLLNGVRDMTGVSGYPSDKEGWGRITLDDVLFFDGDTRRMAFQDIRNSSGMTTGQQMDFTYTINTEENLRITLVWTEPPAALQAASAPINNLDLEVVTPTRATVLGNVFSNGESTSGGSADALNNVEQVLINSPSDGTFTIIVKASEVNTGPQGFGIVVTSTSLLSPTFSVPSFNLIGLSICITLMGVLIFRSSCRPVGKSINLI